MGDILTSSLQLLKSCSDKLYRLATFLGLALLAAGLFLGPVCWFKAMPLQRSLAAQEESQRKFEEQQKLRDAHYRELAEHREKGQVSKGADGWLIFQPDVEKLRSSYQSNCNVFTNRLDHADETTRYWFEHEKKAGAISIALIIVGLMILGWGVWSWNKAERLEDMQKLKEPEAKTNPVPPTAANKGE